jgi:hypothetical protein
MSVQTIVSPSVRRPWRAEVVLGEMRDADQLRRERDWARAECRSLHQALQRALVQLTAARRTLDILAQQALEQEWESEAGA